MTGVHVCEIHVYFVCIVRSTCDLALTDIVVVCVSCVCMCACTGVYGSRDHLYGELGMLTGKFGLISRNGGHTMSVSCGEHLIELCRLIEVSIMDTGSTMDAGSILLRQEIDAGSIMNATVKQ